MQPKDQGFSRNVLPREWNKASRLDILPDWQPSNSWLSIIPGSHPLVSMWERRSTDFVGLANGFVEGVTLLEYRVKS